LVAGQLNHLFYRSCGNYGEASECPSVLLTLARLVPKRLTVSDQLRWSRCILSWGHQDTICRF
jgi:hypothetical protein